MTEPLNLQIAPTLNAPTAGIKKIEPDVYVDFKKCELSLQVGIFFDGTGNNRERDEPHLAHTNIARLASAYPTGNDIGYYKIYIPGVGTPFPDIGEFDYSDLAAGFGFGCESRVLYALLAILNVIHSRSFNRLPLFTRPQVAALCRNNSRVNSADRDALAALGTSSGLLRPDAFGEGDRKLFLTQQCTKLAVKLGKAKPKASSCYIDVFGFSRGAAQARVFCQWLNQIVFGGTLAGVRVRFRFLGIMDTVASAGFLSNSGSFAARSTGGHGSWAAAEFLRIPPVVENCVHMVAMHELRRNFPLDEIGVDGVMPTGCQQYVYPGSHSDVGGGYTPGALGISVGQNELKSDALKLSQIPLNHMLECAISAGVPLRRELAKSGIILKQENGHQKTVPYDPFSIDPQLAQAYNNFLATSTSTPRPIHAWLQPYLNWRWQVRQHFSQLKHVQHASSGDQKLLIEHNRRLINDAELLERTSGSAVERIFALTRDWTWTGARLDHAKQLLTLDPEARQVLERAKKASPTPAPLSTLFDGFVHDSLADFNRPTFEYTGYWRYRKGFSGDDSELIVSTDEAEASQQAA